MKRIFSLLKNPYKIFVYFAYKGCFKWLKDETYLKIMFRSMMGYRLDLKNPKTFNEKLQWLKLNDRKQEYSKYVDKYAVRSYIDETIGGEFLIPLICVYENVEEINWDIIPNKFVLKCTHGSGSNIICIDKDKLDLEVSKIKLNKWIKNNWYWFGREWPYKNVKPRIVCEKFISETDNTPDDYKVLCFNGKAKLIEVHIDRYGNHKQDFYDEKWNKTIISQDGTISDFVYEKPQQFEKMIQLSEKLASDLYHARIDWFVVRNKLYFGEVTFFDGSGFAPFDQEEYDYLLGSWIDLPIEKNDKEQEDIECNY
ncbi:ATP-grasp fold amidoligase family protein [Clostridium sp.]|uniref:ATP-grasp fold amidoligase family protein n=1 Tax=Clostridium sp. TaxID=1506 RepID=UPI003D6CCA6F